MHKSQFVCLVRLCHCGFFLSDSCVGGILSLLFQIKKFEKLETDEERIKLGKEIYDVYIMRELLSQSHVSRSTTCK